MKLLTLEIPDDPALAPEWLESHLMGLDLHQVVTELSILGDTDDATSASLTDVLGDRAAEVLQLGLRSLSTEQVRRFLKQPQLLLDLQRLVLDQGGEYWTTVPERPDAREKSRRAWENVKAAIHASAPKSELARPAPGLRHPWIIAGIGWLSAVAVFLVFYFVQSDRVNRLERRLSEQTAKADDLLRKLNEQLAIAAVRVQPADLPDGGENLVMASLDPADLPGDDPEDLPDAP